jgi:hypothetical protein
MGIFIFFFFFVSNTDLFFFPYHLIWIFRECKTYFNIFFFLHLYVSLLSINGLICCKLVIKRGLNDVWILEYLFKKSIPRFNVALCVFRWMLRRDIVKIFVWDKAFINFQMLIFRFLFIFNHLIIITDIINSKEIFHPILIHMFEVFLSFISLLFSFLFLFIHFWNLSSYFKNFRFT